MSWPATILSFASPWVAARAANSTVRPLLVIVLDISSAMATPDGLSASSAAIAKDKTVPGRAHFESGHAIVILVPQQHKCST